MARDAQIQKGQKVKHFVNTGTDEPPPRGKGHLPEGLRDNLLEAANGAAAHARALLDPSAPTPNYGDVAALLQAAADATRAATAFDVVPL